MAYLSCVAYPLYSYPLQHGEGKGPARAGAHGTYTRIRTAHSNLRHSLLLCSVCKLSGDTPLCIAPAIFPSVSAHSLARARLSLGTSASPPSAVRSI